MMLGRFFTHLRLLPGGPKYVPCVQKFYTTESTSPEQTNTSKAEEVLSTKYGRHGVHLEEEAKDLIRRVQRHEKDFESEEVQIVKLTVKLRYFQRMSRKNDKMKKTFRGKLLRTFERRWQLLNELRRFRYESYEKVLKELSTQHILEPELWVSKTDLAADVEDMRIRAFAEKQKQMAEDAKINEEFETTKNQIKKELLQKLEQ
uniref:Small ribosomal subunit protein uS15m n=1 Tax=Phallusia mammillata TaxID=59560 RepID=A0A6F9DHX9_9ASCI|nr:uncharacterized protein LOC100180232 [Phallusia mammillata]